MKYKKEVKKIRKTIKSVEQTALRGWNHCLFNFGLRSRKRNISKIRQSNLFEHFLSTLKVLSDFAKNFQGAEEVLEQVWLSDFWNVSYSGP